jgi:hypothetical protein
MGFCDDDTSGSLDPDEKTPTQQKPNSATAPRQRPPATTPAKIFPTAFAMGATAGFSPSALPSPPHPLRRRARRSAGRSRGSGFACPPCRPRPAGRRHTSGRGKRSPTPALIPRLYYRVRSIRRWSTLARHGRRGDVGLGFLSAWPGRECLTRRRLAQNSHYSQNGPYPTIPRILRILRIVVARSWQAPSRLRKASARPTASLTGPRSSPPPLSPTGARFPAGRRTPPWSACRGWSFRPLS